MHNVAIVENSVDQAEAVERCVRDSPSASCLAVRTFASAKDLASAIEGGFFVDICLMDIKLDESDAYENGIEAVRRLFSGGCETQVIYVTGYAEYHTPVYETEHVYLLCKPVRQNDLNAALAKAIARLDDRRMRPLAVTVGGKILALSPAKILYLESARRKALIHTCDGLVKTYAKLSDLARKLPSTFFQCHKSYLVNLTYVQELESRALTLNTGEQLPVSRQRSAETREAYLTFLRSSL